LKASTSNVLTFHTILSDVGSEILEVAKECVCGIISEESGLVGGEIHSDMDAFLGEISPSFTGRTKCNFGIDPRVGRPFVIPS
jgi:hypothetical protein